MKPRVPQESEDFTRVRVRRRPTVTERLKQITRDTIPCTSNRKAATKRGKFSHIGRSFHVVYYRVCAVSAVSDTELGELLF